MFLTCLHNLLELCAAARDLVYPTDDFLNVRITPGSMCMWICSVFIHFDLVECVTCCAEFADMVQRLNDEED